MNVKLWEGTIESVAETPSLPLIEMNPLSFPSTSKLSCQEWHASNRVVRSFLKQHVPSFDMRTWQSFYCEVCAKSKSTHQLARARVDITREKLLDLLVSDIMGPVVYPLKSRLDTPAAVLDAITHLTIQLETRPKALRTDNAREFTSGSFTAALAKLGIGFYPSLPYSPQENGEAERLKQTLGDMARAMLTESGMTSQFWQFAYALACYLHKRCPNSSPHQVLYGWPPSIATLYPFGERAIIHVPAVQQSHKLDARGIECQLLKPLLASVKQPNDTFGERGLPTFSNGPERAIASLPLAKDISIPENLKQALAGPDRHRWEQACLDELQQMKKRGVWQAIEKTPAMKTIGHCWVFDTKIGESGNVEKFKARLVARRDRQRPGIDCTETYAPTVSLMSLRLLLATACLQHWKVCSFDVSRSYLYSPVEETVLMEPPTHFMLSLKGKVLHLQKALYGMKQAGLCWWLHLSGILEKLCFTSCKVNMSLYVFHKDETIIAIWIHVDDGVITSNSPTVIQRFHEALCSNFEIKWSENMKRIVGLECVFGEGEVTILQTRLTNDILGAYPRRIIQCDSPLLPIQTTMLNIEGVVMDAMPFRSVIGSLTYLVSGLCPDLAFTVNYLARHSMALTATHWDILDHLVGYLLKTQGHTIILRLGECALNLWGGELE
ncbi:hypothetical protein O181_019343 [Austropuccinia psidii MF-1]|uniref:Integrase catalytic domain-containing protein n=1 Tax=Austropuccinia psidii MF-1 TaxID=1389203 RepID=A0A9Q3C9H2_9BASI|nr:hypothetical protein [Austropuccinia psidii MF-1]